MLFLVRKASDWKWSDVFEIESLEDLQAIAKHYHEELIIDFEECTIMIYDDYVE